MERLGIFVFYDREGIVDSYVSYLLENIRGYLDDLVIVCNGRLTQDGHARLAKFTDSLFVRENKGYDAMAYKMALTEYAGWKKVLGYDEVLLFNDTFFGPLYPFSEVFEKMGQSGCDFWGMTYHAQAADYIYGSQEILPTHVHTYFTAYRRQVLQNKEFQAYWNRFDATDWYFSDVVRHEQWFTQYLEGLGFEWDTYIDAKEYHSQVLENNFNHYFYIADALIRDYRCPILKRKNFVKKDMAVWAGNNGEDAAKALQFVDLYTDYDIDMIWENIIRIYNIAEIKHALHLDYVLPYSGRVDTRGSSNQKKSAVLAYLQDEECLSLHLQYLKQVPDYMDLYLILPVVGSKIEQMARSFFASENISMGRVRFVFIEKQEEANAGYWLSCREVFKEYEHLCCIHDKKPNVAGPETVRRSYLYNLWENMLKSTAYIEQVLALFEKDRRLGFLAPPEPIHAAYLGRVGAQWQDDFDDTVSFASLLGIKANFSRDLQCFALSNAFWCRTKALEPVAAYDFKKDDLQKYGAMSGALEKIYPYVAQSQGYFSGIVMNTGYASLQVTNLRYVLAGALDRLRAKYYVTDYDSLLAADMVHFCKGKAHIFIYGAGTNGIRTSNILKANGICAKGFVVSDGQPQQEDKNGYPIYRLSEVPYPKDTVGMVVSVAYSRDRKDILENLKAAGYTEFFSI